MRIANVEWSSVYLMKSSRPTGGNEGRVLLYADGKTPTAPAAVLANPKEITAATDAASGDSRFVRAGDFWIDRNRLRHTRAGSTALLSFVLSGGRVATLQVPSEVLQQLRPTSAAKRGGRARGRLVGAGA